MLNFLKKNVLLTLIILTISQFGMLTLNAQSPVDCNGQALCQLDANGWRTKTLGFKYDGCKIRVNIRYAVCTNGQHIIDVTDIYALDPDYSPCSYTGSSYLNEIIRFLLLNSSQIFDIADFENMKEIVVKTPSCGKINYYPANGLIPPYSKFNECNTICCVTKYQLTYNYSGVMVHTNTQLLNGQTQSCTPPCESLCAAHLFTVPTNINEADFTPDYTCDLTCYWRLDGNNNVTDENFVGVNNNMPLRIKTRDEQDIIFSTNNTEKMWLQPSGRLSIGTKYSSDIDQSILLSVDGKIISEEVIVKLQSNWPDYVFDQNYNLKSFSELHKFILENKKLPGMPSAGDMQNIEVGKMIPLMIEKIEELTLYLLEIKKENDELKQKIEKLNKGE